MDWEAVLADLESTFEAERRAELVAHSAELAEAEAASIALSDRLRGAVGSQVRLTTRGGHGVHGLLVRCEQAFALVREGGGAQVLVPMGAVASVQGLLGPAPALAGRRRVTLGSALRELARQGARLRLVLTGGEVVGRPVRVGADYVDVVVAGGGGGRPRRVTVALAAVEVVRSR